jgi:hypothetical protein
MTIQDGMQASYRELASGFLFLAVLVFTLTDCHRQSEEDRVRKVIAAAEKAVEQKKISAVQEHLSRSYRDPQGHDYDGIRGLLAFYFFRHRAVSVYIPAVEVTVSGPAATARFQAILTGRGLDGESAGGILPDALGAYDFDVSLRNEEGQWKVVSATWTRSGEGGVPREQ